MKHPGIGYEDDYEDKKMLTFLVLVLVVVLVIDNNVSRPSFCRF